MISFDLTEARRIRLVRDHGHKTSVPLED